jgi:hypothetical protein
MSHYSEKQTMNKSVTSDKYTAPPSKAEMAASVIAKTGKHDARGELVPTSLRIPSWVMCELDAMAAHSGQSRAQIINLVLGAGLEAIKVHLDIALVTELDHLADDELVSNRAKGNNVSGTV